MTGWAHGDIETGRLRLHVRRAGTGDPALVTAHGVTDDGGCWTRLAERFWDRHHVVSYDARGHGRSDGPEGDFTWDVLVDDLIALLESLELGHPVLVGHSMGAATAAGVPAARPDLVGGLVCEDPPWTADEKRPTVSGSSVREHVDSIASADGPAGIEDVCRARHPSWHDTDVRTWADAQGRVQPVIAGLFASPWPRWRALVGQIRCPMLLITGDTSLGSIVPAQVGAEVERTATAATVVSLPAGHSVRREAFDTYVAALDTFLRAVA